MRQKPHKINIITLGCSKNLVDSEVLAGHMDAAGVRVVHDSYATDTRTVVINTCGFIQDAKQESIDTILDYVRARQEGVIDSLYVMGCLSERYRNELSEEIPEVDRYFGVNDLNQVVSRLGGDFRKELVGERLLGTPGHYAYLKISEGCDRKCSFCAIPLIRGKQASRPVDELVREARRLADKGVQEIILIAQDLTAYGTDLYRKRELPRLLEALAGIKELPWIRLHYAYPAAFPDEILYQIRDFPNLCKYLDIPLQHISDPVLSSMRRGIDTKATRELVDRIRTIIPEAALRTTMLVGHPGEGDKEFQELMDFVRSARFERLGAFVYSEEENTWGAGNLEDSTPEELKSARLKELMQVQQSISLEINEKYVGQILNVLIDRREGDFYVGRTEYDSPDVDNEVLIETQKDLDPGKFTNVHITSVSEFDLFGHAV